LLHYIENTGDADLVFLEMFARVDRFEEFSFSEWLAHTPPEFVMAHLKIDKADLRRDSEEWNRDHAGMIKL
jgi:oxalate decarboxylase/phosphoglucose isomerase-like protein (cupin superfamily)